METFRSLKFVVIVIFETKNTCTKNTIKTIYTKKLKIDGKHMDNEVDDDFYIVEKEKICANQLITHTIGQPLSGMIREEIDNLDGSCECFVDKDKTDEQIGKFIAKIYEDYNYLHKFKKMNVKSFSFRSIINEI